jgi:hypothetical protein
MKRNVFQSLAMLAPLIIGIMACSTVSNLRQRYEESRETFQGVATLASGAATQHPGMLETAGSLAVESGSQLASTAESFATQNPGMLETAAALVEEKSASLLETAQALATERPELLETAKALLPGGDDQAGLADIPMPSSYPVEILYSSRDALSYSAEAGLSEILEFYKAEMPANGWELDLQNSFEGQNMSSLRYFRPDRYANVTISSSSALERTLVVIYIENR